MTQAGMKVDFEDLNRKLQQVFPVPKVLDKIMRTLSDPKAGAAAVEKILELEPSFSMRLLSLANSAYYGRSAKVANVRAAITLLGFSLIKSMIIQVGVNEHYRFETGLPGFSGAELWKHSVGVAAGARMISRRLNLGEAEDYYTLGLLHDIGLIIEYQFFREAFTLILERLAARGSDLPGIEREIIGTDHAALSGTLFAKWNLPEKIVRAVCYHHAPLTAPEGSRTAAAVVGLANWIVQRNRFGFTEPGIGALEPAVAAHLKLEPVDVDVLLEDFTLEAEAVEQLLE